MHATMARLHLILTVSIILSIPILANCRRLLPAQGNQKPLTAAGSSQLIQTACHGPDEKRCISIFNRAKSNEKSNATGLALFSLKYVEDEAVNLSFNIKKMNVVPNLPPLLQSALGECLEQYNSVDDIIDSAEEAIEKNNLVDARQYTQTAIGNIEQCEGEFKANNREEEVEESAGDEQIDTQDFKVMQDNSLDLAASNLFLKHMLMAALNLLR